MVPLPSLRVPRARKYSGYRRSSCRFVYETLTLFGWLSHTIRLQINVPYTVHTPIIFLWTVWPVPISLATTFGISFDFFSSPYLDVSVREVPFLNLWIQLRIHGSSPWGFPHSEICGSKLISNSPQLIAGYHVLHRLSVPRHSPYALFRLNSRLAFLHWSFDHLRNNFSFFAWASQIIVLGCNSEKTIVFFLKLRLCPPWRSLFKVDEIVPTVNGKTYICFNNKFFSN